MPLLTTKSAAGSLEDSREFKRQLGDLLLRSEVVAGTIGQSGMEWKATVEGVVVETNIVISEPAVLNAGHSNVDLLRHLYLAGFIERREGHHGVHCDGMMCGPGCTAETVRFVVAPQYAAELERVEF